MDNNVDKRFKVGAVTVTVFINQTQKGNIRTVALQRGYKTREGEWRNTTGLGVNDIPKAVEALQQAYRYMVSNDVRNEF